MLFVADVIDIAASSKLDAFLAVDGLHSVKAAVEADPTLGGTVDDLRVVTATGYKVYGRSTGAELLIATVGNVLTYIDTGSVTPAGVLSCRVQ